MKALPIASAGLFFGRFLWSYRENAYLCTVLKERR
jgi:hypothetical protein